MLSGYKEQHAHILRSIGDESDFIPLRGHKFWVNEKRIEYENGSSAALTRMESLLLLYLYQNRGSSTPMRVLLSEVWGYKTTSHTHTVETHIYRLRRKIDDLLVTDAGGYRLAL